METFAAVKTAGWTLERQEHVMQCTGCADREAAAAALQVAGGNVDQVDARPAFSSLWAPCPVRRRQSPASDVILLASCGAAWRV